MVGILTFRAESPPCVCRIDAQVMDQVAAFHGDAPVFQEADKGFDVMQWIAEDNAKELSDFAKVRRVSVCVCVLFVRCVWHASHALQTW